MTDDEIEELLLYLTHLLMRADILFAGHGQDFLTIADHERLEEFERKLKESLK